MSSQAGQNTEVHVEPVGPFQTNAFFLRKKGSDEVIIIDPGDEADYLIDLVETREWKPVAILNTHAHIDHMGAVQGMKARFSIPFYLHRSEVPVLENTPRSARNWGIPVSGGRRIPLWPDNLFAATASNVLPAIFKNFNGILDAKGDAQANIVIPNDQALIGIAFFTAFVNYSGGSILNISNDWQTIIR